MKESISKIDDFLPDNLNLPFFSYGIFRPGEIAYPVLENLVDELKIQKIGLKCKRVVKIIFI